MSVAIPMGYAGHYPPPAGRWRDPAVTDSERTYALFTHLAGLLGFIAFIPVAPTLIMWAIKKDRSPFIDDHGREAMNAQISYLLYTLGLFAIAPVTCGTTGLVALAMPVGAVVFTVLAAINASRGEYHRYPATIRFFH